MSLRSIFLTPKQIVMTILFFFKCDNSKNYNYNFRTDYN